MIEIGMLFEGMILFLDWFNILLIIIGVTFGVLLGAIPGVSASIGIALMIPITFAMTPLAALIFLVSIYTGGLFGGAITSILINTPGSASNVASTLDGYAMTKKGLGGRALGIAIASSCAGGMIGAIVLLTIIQPLASFALKFGPTEMFVLAIFGLTIITSIQEGGFIKALFAGLLGVLIGTIGMTSTGGNRGTFDSMYLLDGIPMVPALIGLFAVSEIFFLLEKKRAGGKPPNKNYTSQMLGGMKRMLAYPVALIRSSLIGVFIGVLPAAGSTIASLVSYNESKRYSKDKETYGKGSEEGLVAAESANNASEGGSLATMFVLGIPASNSTAIMLGAMIMQGWVPGPRLFIDHGPVLYGVIFSLFFQLLALLFIGALVSIAASRIINIKNYYLLPIITVLAIIGSFAVRYMLFDAILVLIFGVIGWYLRRNQYPVIAVVLGLILGPIADNELLRSVQLHGSDTLMAFVERPFSLMLIIVTILGVTIPILMSRRRKHKSLSS